MNSILEKIENSIISDILTRAEKSDALNLAENTLELFTPKSLIRVAKEAIEGGLNGYLMNDGRRELRILISEKIKRETGVTFNPDAEILITCGASEGLTSTMYSLVESENGVVIPEPFYENYLPIVKLSRGKPIFLKLNEPDFSFHYTDLQKLPPFSVFILNNPHNPTGKVFNEKEIDAIGEAILEKEGYIVVDKSYKDLLYEGEYISPISNEELVERTIVIGSFSTILSISGWRIGYVAAKSEIMDEIRKVHYYHTICAPSPFQWACGNFELSPGYIKGIQDNYRDKRDILCKALKKANFSFNKPQGGLYILADFEEVWEGTDWGFAKYLIKNKKIAVVPGSAFYSSREKGKKKIRLTFSQSDSVLREAAKKIIAGIT